MDRNESEASFCQGVAFGEYGSVAAFSWGLRYAFHSLHCSPRLFLRLTQKSQNSCFSQHGLNLVNRDGHSVPECSGPLRVAFLLPGRRIRYGGNFLFPIQEINCDRAMQAGRRRLEKRTVLCVRYIGLLGGTPRTAHPVEDAVLIDIQSPGRVSGG